MLPCVMQRYATVNDGPEGSSVTGDNNLWYTIIFTATSFFIHAEMGRGTNARALIVNQDR